MSDDFTKNSEDKEISSSNPEREDVYNFPPKSRINLPVNENFDEEYTFENENTRYDSKIKKKVSTISLFWIVFALVLIAVVLVLGKVYYKDIMNFLGFEKINSKTLKSEEEKLGPSDVIKIQDTDPNDPTSMCVESIYEKISPSIVGIVTYSSSADIVASPVGQGSGVIVSKDGYIVTNSHVVGNLNNTIEVVLKSKEKLPANIIGRDPKTDIAVVKVEKDGLTPAEFGNSDEVKIGSWVVAIGNPLGIEFDFECSITQGIISAVNRPTGNVGNFVKMIQTDAAINPGISGGALVNKQGKVIGITTSKVNLPNFEGMGFVVPSKTAGEVGGQLIAGGNVTGRPKLGISIKPIEDPFLGNNQLAGLAITEINSDSDLNNVGIKVGDIITEINGTRIESVNKFHTELYKCKPGDTVKLKIYKREMPRGGFRNGEYVEKNVKLIEDKGEPRGK